ncbi:MAG: PQQ-binding-like beta-propeller repeat protein [bacterium]|nr:PQQ-binding-like beta-propeller repeat protein [bacterium]
MEGWDGFGASLAAVRRELAVGAPGLGEVHVIDRRGATRRRLAFPPAALGADVSLAAFGRSVASTLGIVFVASQSTWSPMGRVSARLWAFDARTGALRWQAELPTGSFGRYPLAAGGRVVAVAVGKEAARKVLLLDARTGAGLGAIEPPAGVRGVFGFSIHLERARLVVGALGDGGRAAPTSSGCPAERRCEPTRSPPSEERARSSAMRWLSRAGGSWWAPRSTGPRGRQRSGPSMSSSVGAAR